MSYEPPFPVSPIVPAPPPRPGSVTTAGVLMLVGAVVGVVGGALTVVAGTSVGPEFTRRAAVAGVPAAEIARFGDSVRASFITVGVGAIVLGVLIGVLALLVLRGSNPARITTWVVLAVSLCWGCGNGLIATAVGNLN